MRPSAALLLLLLVVGCDCERRELEQRLEALRAEAQTAHAAIDHPTLEPGYRRYSLDTEGPLHLIVGLDEVVFDETDALAFRLRTLAEGGALPEVPAAPVRWTALTDGRIEGELDPLPPAILARHVDGGRGPSVELFVDRRVPAVTVEALEAALEAERLFLQSPVVEGPEGLQRLPYLQNMTGPPVCRRPVPQWTEPAGEAVALEPRPREGFPQFPEEACDHFRDFTVRVTDEGYRVVDRVGTIAPGCGLIHRGTSGPLTVPMKDGAYDPEALARCMHRLHTRFPEEHSARLEVAGDTPTMDDMIRTWHAIRGTEDEPSFDAVR